MGNRRRGREAALKVLYMLEFQADKRPEDLIEEMWEIERITLKTKDFTKNVVMGTCVNMASIDTLIVKYAKNWKLNRISCVDRNIIRLSIYELIYRNDIPARVTINEALEIAKKYSTDDSGRFINGLLDIVFKEVVKKSEKAERTSKG